MNIILTIIFLLSLILYIYILPFFFFLCPLKGPSKDYLSPYQIIINSQFFKSLKNRFNSFACWGSAKLEPIVIWTITFLYLIVYYLLTLLIELFKISLVLLLLWFFYKFTSLLIIETQGFLGLIIFNILLFLFFFSFLEGEPETRVLHYNFISLSQIRRSMGRTAFGMPHYITNLRFQGSTWGRRIYTPEGKYSETEEYYPWSEVKLFGVSCEDLILVFLLFYISVVYLLPVLVFVIFLIVNIYIFSIKLLLLLLLPIKLLLLPIITFIFENLLNFPTDFMPCPVDDVYAMLLPVLSVIIGYILNIPTPSLPFLPFLLEPMSDLDFDILYMLICSIIPIKTSLTK